MSRRSVLLAVIAVLVVVALSVGVGFLGANEPSAFDWELAALMGTALGTTLLAVGTGVLAWSSRLDAEATRDLVHLTRQEAELREQPMVVVRHARVVSKTPMYELEVEIVNVGLGPALHLELSGTQRESSPFQLSVGSAKRPVLLPGEKMVVSLMLHLVKSSDAGQGLPDQFRTSMMDSQGFDLVGSYSDRTMGPSYDLASDWRSEGHFPDLQPA